MAKERKAARQTSAKQPAAQSWFEQLSNTRKDILSVLLLFALIFALFNEIILYDKVFATEGDTAAAMSFHKGGQHVQESENADPLWLPFIFSGMPGFGSLAVALRSVSYVQDALHLAGRIIFLNAKESWMVMHYFLGGVFMFLLGRVWKFSHLASLIAAVTFMLAPYSMGLATAGHGSKLMALSYIPLIFLLTHTLFEQRSILSLGLLAAALGTFFFSNHIQIVYYGMMLIGLYLLFHAVSDVRENVLLAGKKAALLAAAVVVGFAISAYIYLSVYEYAQYSIRGGGEAGVPGGLNYDYATNWSFHPFEMFNFLIPSFFGFASPYYWGWMPFTESSVYIGIVPWVLGILALVYRRNRITVFLALFGLLMLLISFGKHFPLVYDLFFHYVPFFNKFRAPVMILHLMPFVVGILAAYGFTFLQELHQRAKEIDAAKLQKSLSMVAALLGALLVIGFLAKGMFYDAFSGFMFEKEGEMAQLQQQFGAQAPQALAQLKQMRFDLLADDFVKFVLIAGASLALLIFYLKRSMKAATLGVGLLIILIIDLLIIDTKFISPRPQTDLERKFAPDATVQFLKLDTTLYRIFPLGARFQDNWWMYHAISSIGGYSPAKVRIYQDVLDSCLFRGWDPNFPINMNIVNMLNAKYLIAQGRIPHEKFTVVNFDQTKNLVTHVNPDALPRAWLVENAIVVRNRTETFSILNSPTFNPRTTAILEKQPPMQPTAQDSTHVAIESYGAHRIVLSVYCSHPALLVLSEVYYPAGWKAFIDGKETEIYKTNHILRSVSLPSGKHRVEFVFDPPLYHTGLTVTTIGWLVTAALVVVGLLRHPSIRAKLKKVEQSGRAKTSSKVSQ